MLEDCLLSNQTDVEGFTDFVAEVEPRLRRALTATFGAEGGREATAEALLYGWKHWSRVCVMENPAGYLYRVGRDRGRSSRKPAWIPVLEGIAEAMPWVEPGLPRELAALPEKQRTVFVLVHGYQWTFGEVAVFLGVTKATVQTHETRAMAKLRKRLGVTDEN